LTLQLGVDVMVAAKVKMRPCGGEEALLRAINRCEAELRQAYPQVRWCFFEPDLED
jgi:hypothetical protein